MTLKFNSFRGLNLLRFQSNGEEKLDACQNRTYDYSFGGRGWEKLDSLKVGPMTNKKRGKKMGIFKVGHLIKLMCVGAYQMHEGFRN